MLFNSAGFLFCFLPVALLGYHLAGRLNGRLAIMWLAAASLVFYAVWRPAFLLLLGASILMNFGCSRLLARENQGDASRRVLLILGIGFNIALLAWFKYLFPFLHFLHGLGLPLGNVGSVVLPLGISFFTFTQIGYLVDLSQGQAEKQDIVSYTLFVTFFPHLIAGPILHHKEMMPQFAGSRRHTLNGADLSLGFSWFVLGLAKKVLVADKLAPFADQAFSQPQALSMPAAWLGALCYSMQLYFDFSGYCDMAIGLARMFSIRFPFNFNSPYKATNIIAFWQRWHMTLTRYLTLYVYNPIALSVNRRRLAAGKKVSKKAAATGRGFTAMIAFPTMATMFLAGIWHGAGTQFLIFGLLHGIYISLNHAWIVYRGNSVQSEKTWWTRVTGLVTAWTLTYVAVLVGQIFFRAASTHDAITMLRDMVGLNSGGGAINKEGMAVLLLFPIVWFMPNTQEIMGQAATHSAEETKRQWWRWTPSLQWSMSLGLLFTLALLFLNSTSSFLYFQF